ncbi:MAG TPA: hypothetical protein VLB84_18650, partial [Bacteroidia bacterium]|nr:hypothetical protein [Bacteroidia bacterium]
TLDDVNAVLDNNGRTRSALPCNVDIDSAAISTGLIKLTYHGKSCDGLRDRSGIISIQFPYDAATGKFLRWSAKGARIIITYDNYKVTNLTTNKSIVINGAITATNVNGGGIWTLLSGTSIIHKLRGHMEIKFDDGTTGSWIVARSRVYTLTGLILNGEITGDTTVNGNSNVAYWGKNRAGEEFSVSIPTPIAANLFGTLCLYRPYKGVAIIRGVSNEITITYGVDINGNPVSGMACPFGYKLNWTDAAGTAHQVVLPY